ncbi:MAG: hypothetical protein ACREBE_20945 [bacterium]
MPSANQNESKRQPAALGARNAAAWTSLGWLGIAFILLGLADIGLGIFPPAFGNPGWVFGTTSAVLNGFAIPTMGTYLYLGSVVVRGSRTEASALAALMLVIAVALVAFGMLHLSVTPVALDAVRATPDALLAMRKGIAKAAMLDLAYIVLYVAGAARAWTSR